MNRLQHLFFLALLGLLACNACNTNTESEKEISSVSVRLSAEPDRLNPILLTNAYGRPVADQIFMYLITVHPQSLELVPYLAKSMPTSTDITEGPYAGGVAYTFEIHEDAVWANGTPVTANDFIFTMKATLNPRVQAQQVRTYLTFLRDVEVDPNNPKKFTVLTSEKYFLGMEAIANSAPVLPEYLFDPQGLLKNIALTDLTDPTKAEALAQSNPALQQFADFFNSPAVSREKEYLLGSGAYQLETWETGQRVVLVKKPNWWGSKLAAENPVFQAYPERIEYRIIPESATALAALKAGEMDAIGDIDPKDFVEIQNTEATKSTLNFYTPPQLAYACIFMNNKNPKLSDKRVRRAIAHTINMDEVIKTVYEGFAERIAVPLLPFMEYYDKDLKPIEFDIQKAKDLLGEAGWTDTNNNGIVDKEINGERVEMNLTCLITANRETTRNFLLLMQGTAKQAGINIEIVPKEFSVIMDDVRRDEYELANGGRTISPTNWEPAQDWHSDALQGGSNNNNFQNAQADKLIEQIRVTIDEQERYKLYKQLERILYEEQPCIFAFSPTMRVAINKRIDTKPTSIPPGFMPNAFSSNLEN